MNRRFDVHAAFVKEAGAQGIEIRRTLPDGRIVVAIEGSEATVSLENLSRTPIRVERIQRHRLGMFETHSVFKASLIFSPNLKQALREEVGWPVYAVIPCRDFAYVFPVRDEELIPRVGKVVVQEYRDSGYPITTDVLEISDKGIRATGTFPVE